MSKTSWLAMFVLALSVLPAGAQARLVRLLDEVVVQGDTICFSDLLPLDAALELRSTAERISLGRAPEPGSFRIFSAEQLQGRIARAMGIEFPSQIVVRRVGWPLRVESVGRALLNWNRNWHAYAARSFDLSQARLVLPLDFYARSADPVIEVANIRRSLDPRTLTADLRCQERAACGSFRAEIIFPQTLPPEIKPVDPSRAAHTKFSGRYDIPRPVLVRPGKRASLVVEEGGLRITESVFPLQRAGLNETIRVLDPVSHRVLVAEVAGDGWLRIQSSSGPRSPRGEIK